MCQLHCFLADQVVETIGFIPFAAGNSFVFAVDQKVFQVKNKVQAKREGSIPYHISSTNKKVQDHLNPFSGIVKKSHDAVDGSKHGP
mmetsp:Transcript_14187/g.30828  ORF Transcript_14187/g.30828 Transcript_14187/m.30828 type:complete len:87 (-) Transcript_14187:142-402(-)